MQLYKTRLVYACYLFAFVLLIAGCTNHNIDPDVCVDTVDVSYNSDVYPILHRHCISCHDAQSFEINIKNFNSVKAAALRGELSSVVTGKESLQMPPDYKLSRCDITVIEHWVQQGAPQN